MNARHADPDAVCAFHFAIVETIHGVHTNERAGDSAERFLGIVHCWSEIRHDVSDDTVPTQHVERDLATRVGDLRVDLRASVARQVGEHFSRTVKRFVLGTLGVLAILISFVPFVILNEAVLIHESWLTGAIFVRRLQDGFEHLTSVIVSLFPEFVINCD